MTRALSGEFVPAEVTRYDQHSSIVVETVDGGFAIGWVQERYPRLWAAPADRQAAEVRIRLYHSTGVAQAASSPVSDARNGVGYELTDAVSAEDSFYLTWRLGSVPSLAEAGEEYATIQLAHVASSGAPYERVEIASSSGPYLWGNPQLALASTGALAITYFEDDYPIAAISRNGSFDYTFIDQSPRFSSYVVVSAPGTQDFYALWNDQEEAHSLHYHDLATGAEILIGQGFQGAVQDAIYLPDGKLVVAGTYLDLFTTEGEEIASEITYAPAGTARGDAQIAGLANGGFVITWVQFDITTGDGSGSSIWARTFDQGGNATSAAFLVNQAIRGDQADPFATGLSNGNFVISWTDWSGTADDSGAGVKARMFASDGVARPVGVLQGGAGNETLIGTPAADIFFFDTAAGENFGVDVIKAFSRGDRIVTTSALLDANGDALIRFDSSDRLHLLGTSGNEDSSRGVLKAFYDSGQAVSTLRYLGFEMYDGVAYHVYAGAGDLTAQPELVF